MTKLELNIMSDLHNLPSDLKRVALERRFTQMWDETGRSRDYWIEQASKSPYLGDGPRQINCGPGIASLVRYIHQDALFLTAVRGSDVVFGQILEAIKSGDCRPSKNSTKTGADIGVPAAWSYGGIFEKDDTSVIDASLRDPLALCVEDVIRGNSKFHKYAEQYGIEGVPAPTAAPTPPAQVKSMTKIEITGDEGMKSMVSAGIHALTKGEVPSIDVFAERFNSVAEHNEILDASVKDLESKLEKLRKRAQTPVAPTQATYKASGEMPAFEMSLKNAQEVFEMDSKLLDRDIPTFNYESPCQYVPDLNPHYQFRLSHLAKITFALANNKRIFFTGHTGTGKTTLGDQVCARTQQGFVRINFDGGIERADLVGTPEIVLENGQQVTKFQYGALPKALKMPVMLMLDEADAIRGPISFVLQSMLEGRGLRILENGGEIIMPHELCRIVGSGNTVGQGDVTGLYGAATQAQSAAQYDRWQMFVVVEYLTAENEVKLAKDVVPDFEDGEGPQHLEAFISDYRNAFLRGEILMPISPRTTIAMAEMITDFRGCVENFPDAFKLAVETALLDKASPDDRAVIQGICDRRF